MDAILGLINKYNLQDPVGSNEAGVFTSPELQELYNSLTEPVETLEEALAIGALIEEVDIQDLVELLEQTDNQDVTLVYNNLNKGSANHLRAFVKRLASLGVIFENQHLSSELFEAILSLENGRKGRRRANNGNGDCDGTGSNGGNGNCDGTGSGSNGNSGNGNGNGNSGNGRGGGN